MGIFVATSLLCALTRNNGGVFVPALVSRGMSAVPDRRRSVLVGYVVFVLPGVVLTIGGEFGFWFANAAGSQHALVPTGAMGGEVVATGPRAE